MFKQHTRLVIALRIFLPAVALAGFLTPFMLSPDTQVVEDLSSAKDSNFANLHSSRSGTVTGEEVEVQIESALTQWKDGVASSTSVVGKANGPNDMEVVVRASSVNRVGSAATVSFSGGAELTTNFGYTLLSDGFQLSVEELDFNSVGEVFLIFPAGFGAVGEIDFSPAKGSASERKFPGSLKLENNVIIIFNVPVS